MWSTGQLDPVHTGDPCWMDRCATGICRPCLLIAVYLGGYFPEGAVAFVGLVTPRQKETWEGYDVRRLNRQLPWVV